MTYILHVKNSRMQHKIHAQINNKHYIQMFYSEKKENKNFDLIKTFKKYSKLHYSESEINEKKLK